MSGLRPSLSFGALLAGWAFAAAPVLAGPWEDCQQTNDPDLAIERCTTFLATASGDQVLQANYSRGLAYYGKHDYYHAAKDFTAVIASRPIAEVFAYRGLAYVAESVDDPALADAAIADLNKALSLKPDLDPKLKQNFSYAYVALAATDLAKGQDQQALSDTDAAAQLNQDKAQEFNADLAEAHRKRAWQALAAGQYARAAGDLQQAIQLDPTRSDILSPYLQEAQSGTAGAYSAMAKGDEDEKDGAYDRAINDYTNAIQAHVNLSDAYLSRGYAYQAVDHFDKALADFDQVIKLDPNNWRGLYARGKLYQSVAQFDEARGDFSQASKAVDQLHDANAEYDKKSINEAVKSLQFDSTLADHWVSYLKQIQAADNYPNWSSAPFDLYAGRPKLTAAIVSGPRAPWYLGYLEWGFGAIGFAATYLYFTRRRA